MPIYRIFHTENGHSATPPVMLELPDDATALSAAEWYATPTNGSEVWVGKRLIRSLPPVTRRRGFWARNKLSHRRMLRHANANWAIPSCLDA